MYLNCCCKYTNNIPYSKARQECTLNIPENIYLQYTIFSGPTGMYVKYTTQYILAVYIFLGPDRNAR